jgi:MFS family permease
MDSALKQITTNRAALRIAVGSLFFLAGLCFASWTSRIVTIQHTMHLSNAGLGAVLFSLPVGLMCSLPFSGWIITKIGSKRLLVGAVLVYGFALVSLGLSQNIFQLVVSLFCYGFAGNTLNISVNTQAAATESLYNKPIMASFHGLWGLGGFTGAGIGIFMIGHGISPFYHFTAILAILVVGIIISSGHLYNDAEVAKKPSSSSITFRQRINEFFQKISKLFAPLIPLGTIAFCSMICEGAMFDWSNVYLKQVILAPPELVGIGFTAFMSTMASGRFIADRFVHRYGLKRTLQISGSLTASGLLIAVFFPYFYTTIAGFLLVGAGVCSVVPMVYSAAGKSKTTSAGVAITVVSTIGFTGFLVGPPVIGFIAGLATLRVSFLLIACMGASVAVLATRARL